MPVNVDKLLVRSIFIDSTQRTQTTIEVHRHTCAPSQLELFISQTRVIP